MSRLLNCCLYLSRDACGTAQSEGPPLGELLANDKEGEEFELLEPRSSKDGVLFIGVAEKPSGEEENELDSGRVEASEMGVGCRMAIGPLGRAGVLMVGITGIDRPVPIMGVMPGMVLIVVIGIGVRMGTLGIMGTFGIVPIPRGVAGMVGAGTGGCFMMIGRAVGRFCPCSFILISFMAIENSSRSILPSLFISARVQISASTD